jgi:arginine decarboxylase
MTGAYQDSLANSHNLLMRTHEVIVRRSDDPAWPVPGCTRVEFNEDVSLDIKAGETIEDALAAMDFDVEHMVHELRERHQGRETTLGEAWALGMLQSYPYLNRE